MPSTFWLFLLALFHLPAIVWGHARLMSPPSRSSMWRLGFPTRKNFNDNALYCGGMQVQWQRNGGKCGICGDPYDMPHPRDNEAGGKYGRGIISRRYLSGQVMEATVEVTTNHRGYFEFKLCPNNNPKKEATQECLDKHILREAGGIGTRYYIGDRGRGDITVHLQLPKGLTCSQCVFQWTYVAGNNWGLCENGQSALGCGPQETFRGCADIAIERSSDVFNFRPSPNDVRGKAPNPKRRKQGYYQNEANDKYPDYTLETTKQNRKNGSRHKYHDEKNRNHYSKRYQSKRGEFYSSRQTNENSLDLPQQIEKPNASVHDAEDHKKQHYNRKNNNGHHHKSNNSDNNGYNANTYNNGHQYNKHNIRHQNTNNFDGKAFSSKTHGGRSGFPFIEGRQNFERSPRGDTSLEDRQENGNRFNTNAHSTPRKQTFEDNRKESRNLHEHRDKSSKSGRGQKKQSRRKNDRFSSTLNAKRYEAERSSREFTLGGRRYKDFWLL
ncbi:uncharacterized protein DDB_G0283357-like [Stegodyphus dumicola]|uniref:uncharacterized protein DDB_G0283357-like n=1 Tax=Stegodyphus dumicola TaxID=202533 RepID=UPI0015AED512|nr:uncharacterized protein DDB_G0283357-like [Stegodyphus dumicola]